LAAGRPACASGSGLGTQSGLSDRRARHAADHANSLHCRVLPFPAGGRAARRRGASLSLPDSFLSFFLDLWSTLTPPRRRSRFLARVRAGAHQRDQRPRRKVRWLPRRVFCSWGRLAAPHAYGSPPRPIQRSLYLAALRCPPYTLTPLLPGTVLPWRRKCAFATRLHRATVGRRFLGVAPHTPALSHRFQLKYFGDGVACGPVGFFTVDVMKAALADLGQPMRE